MPQLKIVSVTVTKESDIPKRTVNTAMGDVATQILAELKAKPQAPALTYTLSGAGKYTRYALQKRLQKNGAKVVVRSGASKDQFVVVHAS